MHIIKSVCANLHELRFQFDETVMRIMQKCCERNALQPKCYHFPSETLISNEQFLD